MGTVHTIAPIIEDVYGRNPMAATLTIQLANVIEAEDGVDERQIMLLCWDYFSGGDTAALVARRVVEALDGLG
jgi:hypothetical protein